MNLKMLILLLMSSYLFCDEVPQETYGPQEPKKTEENSTLKTQENFDAPKVKLLDVFSVEKTPGSGTLIYKNGDHEEKITLGQSSGLYGFAMTFEGSLLPESYQKDFSESTIIQLAFGRLKSHLGSYLPQFLALTLLGEKPKKSVQTYPIIMPEPNKKKAFKKMALVLFSSPNTLSERLDEEKLQGTFFAETGSVKLSLIGKSKKISSLVDSETLWFKLRVAKITFDVTLGTPFVVEKGNLTGTVEIPIFSPINKASIYFTRKLASDSFDGTINQFNGKIEAIKHKK